MLGGVVLALLFAGCAHRPYSGTGDGGLPFTGGAPSPVQLVERYLDGLRRKDEAALRTLTVDRDEYVTIVLPGRVAPGERLAGMPLRKREYFWGLNHTRSQYALLARLNEYGGRNLTLSDIRYAGPPEQFALYTVLRNPVVTVKDEANNPSELRIGSILERGGSYKFSSFFWD